MISAAATRAKNSAVSHVHAIQASIAAAPQTRPRAKPLAM
jgi:hypothetical protein